MYQNKFNFVLWLKHFTVTILLIHLFVINKSESKSLTKKIFETENVQQVSFYSQGETAKLALKNLNPDFKEKSKTYFGNTIISSNSRVKRSPYPPGYIIWSKPSVTQPLPCHCSPGHKKCRCLKLLERIAIRSRRTTSNSKRT